MVFAFVVNARTYALWQIGPLIALVVLIAAARGLPWRLPLGRLARLSIYPALVFALGAAILIGIHHQRRDATVYDTVTFGGHGYWLTYIGTTMPFFMSRIPELERESGVTIEDGDAYVGALLRIKIKERGETLDDYMTPELVERHQARATGATNRIRLVAELSRGDDRELCADRSPPLPSPSAKVWA